MHKQDEDSSRMSIDANRARYACTCDGGVSGRALQAEGGRFGALADEACGEVNEVGAELSVVQLAHVKLRLHQPRLRSKKLHAAPLHRRPVLSESWDEDIT